MAPFPPGKGGGEGIAWGGKGKGVLIHILTDGSGMPLSHVVTPANGDERKQVERLLEQVKVRTSERGRARSCPKVIAADKGYDSKGLRLWLRKKGIRPQLPKRQWKSKPNRGRPIKTDKPRFQMERCFAWLQRKYRRLVVRWERIARCFHGFVTIAVCHLWVKRLVG
ncbi:Transposase [Legionella massiliensis]|uniref:Transposase n=1 Tax=Legionella massiliensis TaxID=1034943 RepID=A0A078KYM3_9GAMM|nr:IS5/IS1182 family transposase [Legionella massiliensis]CDZ79490.1 Transposase [Legionella massiliensis]CEE15228.1 Transposase DDE domain protein [Legionella massiliensis]